MAAIELRGAVKRFGPIVAVDGLDLEVPEGICLGLLGPNGAGKSTTMRMVTGFIPPTAGRITVGGYDVLENPIPAKRLIGYLPENAPGYADMTVRGFLNFAAELRGIHGDARNLDEAPAFWQRAPAVDDCEVHLSETPRRPCPCARSVGAGARGPPRGE